MSEVPNPAGAVPAATDAVACGGESRLCAEGGPGLQAAPWGSPDEKMPILRGSNPRRCLGLQALRPIREGRVVPTTSPITKVLAVLFAILFLTRLVRTCVGPMS